MNRRIYSAIFACAMILSIALFASIAVGKTPRILGDPIDDPKPNMVPLGDPIDDPRPGTLPLGDPIDDPRPGLIPLGDPIDDPKPNKVLF